MKKELLEKVEKNNLEQINRLNHKSTMILSIIELIENGLLNVKLAGLLLFTVLHEFSFIVAAGPNGAGKSTLMGALLTFLKPGIRIVTFREGQNLLYQNKQCIIAHEIYNRPFYGYIWGKEAASFIALAKREMIATTVHATNINELNELLLKPPLNVEIENLYNIDLVIFIKVEASLFQIQRKIDSIYYSCNEKLELLYSSSNDSRSNDYNFERYINKLAKRLKTHPLIIYREIDKCTKFVMCLQKKQLYSFPDIRKEYLQNFWGICKL